MKLFSNKLFYGVVVTAITLGACNPISKMSTNLKKAKFTMIPEILEVRGDSVDIGFKMVVPKGAIHKKGVIKLEPILRYGSDELVLKPYIIKGEKAEDPNANVTMKSEGGTVQYTDRVLYTPEMKRCTLYIQPNIKLKNDYDELLEKCIEIPKDSLGLGCITTSKSYRTNEEVAMPDSKCSGPKMERKANIYYIVDTWDFKPKLVQKKAKTSNPDELKTLVSYLQDKSGYNVVGLSLASMASPDGTYKRNALLSRNRDVTVYNFLKKEMNRLGFTAVNDSLFTSRVKITEQFEGMKEAIEASSLKDKDFFLNILNSNDDPDVKERKMRGENDDINTVCIKDKTTRLCKGPHGISYRYILDYIMPRLRRSEITVIGEKGCKAISEIAGVAKSGMDNLTIDELLYYGGSITETAEQERVYRHISTKYSDDWRGHNNLGAVLISQKKYSDAKVALDKAMNVTKDKAEVYNNMGICYRSMKMYEKSEENYKMAKARGLNVGYNMGILNMARGQYSDAVSNFKSSGKTCTYNMALAYTMNGEYTPADGAIKCQDPKELDKDAQGWYLRAIIAARSGNASDMATYLKKTIQIDSKYRAIASEDLEFFKYFKSTEFKTVVGN
jgi:tetratricopeptide (TPR) repeat protein